MPPTISTAIGFMTSELNPLSHRIGARLQHHHRNRHQFRPEALHRAFDRGLLDVLIGYITAGGHHAFFVRFGNFRQMG